MKEKEYIKNNSQQIPSNSNQMETLTNLLPNNNINLNEKDQLLKLKISKTKRFTNLTESNQEKIKRTLLNEFGIIERTDIKTFDYLDLLSRKSCTSYYFGEEPIEQKAFICSVCDTKKRNYMCNYCHSVCHLKCRNTLKEIPKSLARTEFLNIQKFACYCGTYLKHTFDVKDKKDLVACTMMELDSILGIPPYHCYQHNTIVCCICAVVCHKECTVKQEKNYNLNGVLTCQCKSDYHSNFNELALSFPLEQYKKVSNIDVWPVQILNILFYKGKTFNKMSQFFNKSLSLDIDFNSETNNAIINKFKSLLELFSDTFNRKFKTYYYDQQMINTFEFEKLFNVIKHLEVNNGQTAIIKFRLLFILLFIHLRKDFRTIKSLTSNDFMCNSVLQRLTYKKLLKSKTILTEKIDEKYRIRDDFPVKTFALNELCNLMTKGMHFISVEENQDEFEIGLKLICFMLKRLMFSKEDLILLIDSMVTFHSKFYNYIMKEKNNIYSLIDIFNAIIEICYMISVNYNDIIIEDYLDNKKTKEIGKFIHSKNDHSNKLLSIALKNCDLMTKHYKILIKPSLDKKSEEEQKRERHVQKHLIKMHAKIISQTTGVKTKMPDNGGLFTDKIINLNNETLALFALADNSYQKQLDYITEEDFEDYYTFCDYIEDENYQEIMRCEPTNNYSNNILYNLKLGLEEGYYSLFTSSYIKEEHELAEKLKNTILIACDNIKIKIDNKCTEPYYNNLILDIQQNENNRPFNEIENLKRRILKDISVNINFANSPFLLIDEGRELIVNNLILTQVDESIFKGFFFLTNIHFPNIINHELVKLFLDFLSLYFLTKRGTMYILTGKNIQVIQRLINRFRFDDKDKNVNQQKHRTQDFNIKSIKVVIHFLCMLSRFVKKLNIKTLKRHKALFKFKKSILNHLKNFVKHIDTEELLLEYKIQLKEGLEIFDNLYEEFNFNQYEKIKKEIIEIFINNPFNFLSPPLFQKWFDANTYNNLPNYKQIRKYDLDFYFTFFEIITKNSFYVYENDEEGKIQLEKLINFIDLENLSRLLINSPQIINYKQKTILLKFIRTFYLLDYLDPVDFLKKRHLLTTKQYKYMLKYNLINNNQNQYNNNGNNMQFGNYINNNMYSGNINPNYPYNTMLSNNQNLPNNNLNENERNINKEKYMNKLKYIEKLIILINFYIKEIENFPNSIKDEYNYHIKKYINELIFATQEISIKIYYSKDVFNKILPYYYKLVVQFIKKKEIFIKILEDIEENKTSIIPSNYHYLLNNINNNIDYQFIISRGFNVFDKEELFKCAIKSIYDIYKITKINEEYCLQKYLEIYDVYNEANFPPFSLIEVYDYEYFYEGQNKQIEENNESNDHIFMLDFNNKDNNIYKDKLNNMRELYLEQFRNISDTAFLNVLSGDAIDKKIDFGEKYVNLFQSFINSTQSNSFTNYRTLLCIMTKMLFYDGEHIQGLFNEMASDKYFFKNLNRELNYYIVQSIDLSQKYELCSRCAEITDMTKLTIQFLQLLGEGFNTQFHENILKGVVKEGKQKVKNEVNQYNLNTYEENYENEDESSSNDSLFDENGLLLEKNNNLVDLKESYMKKEVQLVDAKSTIYETVILNLKRIYHLMELNNLLEGESGFDKLCVLSTNIIDFIIEYIDTLDDFSCIIDTNFKKLFFGTEKNDKLLTGYSYMNKRGILPIFTMKIKDYFEDKDDEYTNKYKLRKTMLAYMKIKYFQLLKAYLQIGNKNDFVQQLIAEHLGPIQLFGEILYYMKELINNLIYKDYNKYNHLLNVDNVGSYKDKLTNLYMFEDDFRTSVEISVVFQICIIIATLEETYKISMLRDHFDKEFQDKNEPTFFIGIDNDNNTFNPSFNEEKLKEIDEQIKQVINVADNQFNQLNNSINTDINDTNTAINNKLKESNMNFILPDKNNTKVQNIMNYYKDKIYKEKSKYTPYNNIKENYQKNKIKKMNEEKISKLQIKKVKKLGEENVNLNSKFSKAIYKFLDSLVSRVEIRTNDENSDNKEDKKVHFNSITNQIAKKIINYKNEDIILSNINYNDLEGNNLDNNIDNEPNLEDNINEEDDNDNEEEDSGKKRAFFIKPYLSFHLSDQSKKYFLYNVDRTSATSKYKELIAYSDYFMFEMMFNMKYINNSNVFKWLSNISFYVLQVINYLLILAENCLLMYHYYRDYSLDYDEYELVDDDIRYKRFTEIIIIIVVKLILIFFACFVWFYSKFIITYQRNVMIKEDKNFIFRQLGKQPQNIIHPTMVKFFRENGNLSETMSLINEDIGFFTMLKLAVIDSVLSNIDINTFVFSFILDVLFLIFGHPLFLSIETLFLYGIFPSLLNIFKSFTEKFSSLMSCLIFTYLILYVYNYIAIFYMRDAFDFGEVMEYESENYINEPFCHSSLQCFLVLISYGTRAGGGIGDVLPIISFKHDVNMFVGRFIYDMTFFIIIIMIMGNVTFGLVVDTFGALRDDTYQYENDRTNICFICQLSKDGCLLKNIDYEKHIKRDHNLWSYVDFLTYLHLYNANDFTRIEGSVWDRLLEKDYGWLPIDPDAREDDDDD